MGYSLLLVLHICGGTMGLLSGTTAMAFPKGSRGHVVAGKAFVASMLTMAAAAVYLAILKRETPNILAGTLTFYLITTAWLTARRRDGETNLFDRGVLLIPLVTGSWVWVIGLQKLFSHTPQKDGVPVEMNFFIGFVMLLCALGDIRMLARGGLSGTKRLVRHLWRMCFGLFIAAGSFFLGPANRPLRLLSAVRLGQHLPAALFTTSVYVFLTVLPLILMIFWLLRVRFTRAYRKTALPFRPQEVRPEFRQQALPG